MSRTVRRLFAALTLVTCSLLPTVKARAQGVDDFGGYGTRRGEQAESPQDAAFELRLGRYLPEVDSSVPGTPFQDTFGTDNRYTFGAEVDWQLLRIPHFGTLAPGIGWSYTKFTERARFADGSGLSASTTRLAIMPMYLVAVARADVVDKEFRVPLVPYAKLGLGYALWWSSDGQRSAMSADGKKGKGASYGPTYALGLMLLLDALAPEDAKSADGLMGINNSYVFAEWFRPQLDGFGSSKVLDLSSNSWVLGIALEM